MYIYAMYVLLSFNRRSCCLCHSPHPCRALTGLQELISAVPNPSLEVHCPTVFACGMRIYLLKWIWQHEKLYTRICYLFGPPKTLARPVPFDPKILDK
nr:hypothetical protein Iba_chr11dCG0850 [Ipomoea batatas]